MAADNTLNKLNVLLYDNTFTPEKDDYTGKVQSNGTLTNEHIARRIVDKRSEFRYETILQILNLGSEEKRESLASGFTVDDGVFRSYPSVSGNFTGASAQFDPNIHSVSVTAIPSAALRKMMEKAKIVVRGVATIGPVINKVEDASSQTVNKIITPGRNLHLYGQYLKIAGDRPEIGIYFVDIDDETRRIRVDNRDIVENRPSRLIIFVPQLEKGNYYIELVSQQSTNPQKLLKEPRSYRFGLTLEVT